MRRWLLPLCACGLLAMGVAAGRAWGQDEGGGAAARDHKRKVLRGLPGVGVLAEHVKAELEPLGLTREQLRVDAELRLRQNGISVLEARERALTPGSPTLYINVNAIPPGPVMTFSARVEVLQECILARDGKAVVGAWKAYERRPDGEELFLLGLGTHTIQGSTWDAGMAGRDNTRGIRDAVNDLVDAFCNDFLAANPKK